MSQLLQQREHDTLVRARMLKLLGWAPEQLIEAMDEQCVAWLDAVYGTAREVTPGVPTMRRRLEANSAFRAWWANQWAGLDAQLEPRLRVKPHPDTGEWCLQFAMPTIGGKTAYLYFSPDEWAAYYLARHTVFANALRPDDAWLHKVMQAL